MYPYNVVENNRIIYNKSACYLEFSQNNTKKMKTQKEKSNCVLIDKIVTYSLMKPPV